MKKRFDSQPSKIDTAGIIRENMEAEKISNLNTFYTR